MYDMGKPEMSGSVGVTRKGNAKRHAKIAISLIYFVAEVLSRLVLCTLGRPPKRKLVILYYHAIPDAQRSNFLHQIESLRRSAQVWPASYQGSLPSAKPNVAITFDDAFVSVAENALPELAARGFHSTIFVPAALLGRRPTWPMETGNLDASETVMSAEQIANVSSPHVTLGSHTNTHPRLSQLQTGDARGEIEISRASLQGLTGKEVRLFSFPYGDYNATTLELCRVAGFDYVFSISPHPVDTTVHGFVRGRVKAEPHDGRLEFFLKFNGAYAWAAHVSSLKKRLTLIFSGFSNYRSSIQIPDRKPVVILNKTDIRH